MTQRKAHSKHRPRPESTKDRAMELLAETEPNGERRYSYRDVGRIVGVNASTVNRWAKNLAHTTGGTNETEQFRGYRKAPPPKDYEELAPEVQEAHDDFETFFRRYVGPQLERWEERGLPPFWLEIADTVTSGEHPKLLMNVAPGHGKTTLLLGYIMWRLARDRELRVIYISGSNTLAREAFEFVQANFEENDELIRDFGRFKPEPTMTWTKTKLNVDGFPRSGRKGNSLSVAGATERIYGRRAELIVVDDLVDLDNSDTAEKRDTLARWFHNRLETRLEPEGVMVVVGQRLGPHDLYGHLAELRNDGQPIYHRIRYPAHDTSRCPGDGRHPMYPDGCLLWPQRWSFEYFQEQRASDEASFDVIYQQEDVAATDVLVRREWLYGGTDPVTGESCPGCMDGDRRLGQVPPAPGPYGSVLCVDPSPSRFWAIEWWLTTADGDWYLVDFARRAIAADEMLRREGRAYAGVLEEFATRAHSLQHPIGYLIIERNTGNRWLFETQLAGEWARRHMIAMIPHTTSAKNKQATDLGIQGLRPRFRTGKVRFPAADVYSRTTIKPFLHELETYPHSQTDDCVMAAWFLLWNEAGIRPPTPGKDWPGWGVGAHEPPPPHLRLAGAAVS